MIIAIGMPTTGTIKTWTVEYFINMMRATNNETHFFTKTSCFVHENRKDLVKDAKSINADYLFFLDSDIIAEIGVIDKLLAHNKMIIGANPNKRELPLKSMVKFIEDNKVIDKEIPKELFKCSAVSTVCMLIDMKVFDIIDKPYFKIDEVNDEPIGEDVWLCQQTEKKGIEVWCDPTIKIGHIGDYIY
jgi:hypothetical protein